MRVRFLSEAQIQREADDGDANNCSRVTVYFHTRPIVLTEAEQPNLTAIVAELNSLVDNFTYRGSSFVLCTITKLGLLLRPPPHT